MQQLIFLVCVALKKVCTNKIKVKGLGQAFFLKGLQVSKGRSHLVAARKQRNLFTNGKHN